MIKNKDTASNKDITLQGIKLTDHVIKTTEHNTSTVSVIVACTLNPIPIDMFEDIRGLCIRDPSPQFSVYFCLLNVNVFL